jgi:KDO2-lipid IV(A) lauroyltransferase
MKAWKASIRFFIRGFVILNYLLVRLLPIRTAVFTGGIIGAILYYLLKKDRERSIRNLREAFPARSAHEIRSIARESFINQGKNFMELLCFPRLNRKRLKKLVEFNGEEILRENLNKGKGIIILMSHLGNWELQAGTIGTLGYPVNAIARKVYDPVLNGMLVSLRLKIGYRTILRGESPREILQAFKNNEILLILLDQYSSAIPGVMVNFMGRKCYTSIGLASMAVRNDIPVIPCFTVRKGGRHSLYVEEPVQLLRTGDREKDILDNTQAYTGIIEKWVRKYPAQWVWMHDRWRKQKP